MQRDLEFYEREIIKSINDHSFFNYINCLRKLGVIKSISISNCKENNSLYSYKIISSISLFDTFNKAFQSCITTIGISKNGFFINEDNPYKSFKLENDYIIRPFIHSINNKNYYSIYFQTNFFKDLFKIVKPLFQK